MRNQTFLFIFIILASFFLARYSLAQDKPEPEHVKITMTPEFTEVHPGDTLFVAIREDIDDGWHTYWRNPGDSGESPQFTWHMPDGFKTNKLHWPIPERISTGPLTSYGYKKTVTLLQELTIPAKLPDGKITISADIDILVCKETCVPEYHTASFTLNDGSKQEHSDLINDAYDRMPTNVKWDAFYSTDDKDNFIVNLELRTPRLITSGGEKLRFDLLPYEWGVIDNNAVTGITADDRFINVHLVKPRGDRPLTRLGTLTMLMTYQNIDGSSEAQALEIQARPDDKWLAKIQAAAAQKAEKKSQHDAKADNDYTPPDTTFAIAILFAILGGIILNLMPCVFPILSMKALSLVQMSEKSHIKARIHGLTYTAGVMLSFGALAGLLITLQAGGDQIGWGFQLQNPLVVLLLSYLLFMIGLNLSGFYEIRGSFTNVGAGLGKKEGVGESFFTGVLATIVATPCTAPFMGVAMGFALTQPPAVAMCVFLALGFGLALPYLMLSLFPPLRVILPKPGHWMVVFRELLAFPIYASVVWLVWVYSQQIGAVGLLYAMAGFVGLSFAVWIFRYSPEDGGGRLAMRGFAIIVLLTVLAIGISESLNPENRIEAPAAAEQGANWQAFTAKRFTALEQGDGPLFVNMTAAWCITCKVNERVALSTKSAKDLFVTENVSYLKGDWTNQDPEITAYLSRYGRNGVPLYVFYGARDPQTGQRPDPVVLPQLLTPGIIADAIKGE